MLNATFDNGQSEFRDLENYVNDQVYTKWIEVGSKSLSLYYERATELMTHLNNMKKESELCDVQSCQNNLQCVGNPKVNCLEYKLEK